MAVRRRWNDGPDGFDAVRGRLEDEDIAAGYAELAEKLRKLNVYVPEPYTDAEIMALAREHGLR